MKKEIITQSDPKSPISEVFRALRTNIQFMNRASDCQTILITSTVQAEGKSWTSANLATTFAQSGSKTLLIDADMRKPRQHKIFQMSNVPGLSNYLSEINDVGRRQKIDGMDCVKKTEVENLYLLPSGNIPPNPSELLMSDKIIELIDEVTKNFDVVIFDGAPCLLVTDSTIISRLVESTILVTSYKYTKIDDLKEAKKRIKRVGGNIAGVVLNRVEISNKKYEEKYYYASTNTPTLKTDKKYRPSSREVEKYREKIKKNEEDDDLDFDLRSRKVTEKTRKEEDNKREESVTKAKNDEDVNKYINDRIEDTQRQIQDEIKNTKFKSRVEVPSDKAKEILDSIKGYKD